MRYKKRSPGYGKIKMNKKTYRRQWKKAYRWARTKGGFNHKDAFEFASKYNGYGNRPSKR